MLPLSDPWLPRRLSSLRLAESLVLVLALLNHGCGTCSSIEQQYRAWLTDELLITGTGRSPAPGGQVHLRLLLGNEVLRTIASAASGATPFAPVRMQRRSTVSDDAPTYLFRAIPTLSNVLIQSDAGQPALQIALQFNGSVNIERRTDAEESVWTSTIQIYAPLTLGIESDGASLRVDLRRATMGPLVSDSTLTNPEDRTTVDAMLVSELQRQLNESSDSTALLRVPPIGTGRGRVELRAVELRQMDERGGLSLGFVTSLRPHSRSLPATGEVAGPREFRVEMVPDLPEAYARFLVAGNVVPRMFDESGQPDADGVWARSITSLEPAGDRWLARVERWCFRSAPCMRTGAELQFSLGTTESRANAPTADAEGDRRFVQSLIPALGSLMTAPALILASGDTLDVQLQSVSLAGPSITLRGTMVEGGDGTVQP
jgi:hypothetical protein